MDKILSIRRNNQIFSLFIQIQKYQKSANRTEIVNAAITKALTDNTDWNAISNTKFSTIPNEKINIPDFIQLRVNANDYNTIAKQMNEQFHLEKMPPAPYVIRLVLSNYLIFLQEIHSQPTPTAYNNSAIQNHVLTPDEFQNLTSVEDKLDYLYRMLYYIKTSV